MALLGQLRESEDDHWLGSQLVDYQITEFIAKGGMGRVYRAQRTDGSFDRDVAIKISSAGILSQALRERFEREQSVLAGFNHPNITQLYDARVSAQGPPYIVMELVEGLSFAEYCHLNHLSVRERVQLVVDVVDAVAYAHSRLVVHRDVKPSNVLVDQSGQVKLLDFGIAKLLEPGTTELTQSRPMTPLYASPEQLLGQDVTIASDIYQLGLLIYEAVCHQALNQTRSMPQAIQAAANQIPISLDHHSRSLLTPELALIVEQCLRASTEDRYRDANALQADLQRYLDGYPVTAAGQNVGYRLRKWASRNRFSVALGSMAITALVGSAGWYTYHLSAARALAEQEAEMAALQASKSAQISNFLVELLGAAKPGNHKGKPMSVRGLLDQGVEQVRQDLTDQPALQASLLETMGDVYTDLAELDLAQSLLTEAVAIRRQANEPDALALSSALGELAQLARVKGDYQKSLILLEEGLSGLESDTTHRAIRQKAILHNSAGVAASKANNYVTAAKHYKTALSLRTELYGPNHLQTSQSLSNYGTMLLKQGRLLDALPLLRKSLAIADDKVGPYHPVISTRAINLANTLGSLRRWEEGEPLLRRALAVDRHLYGTDHHFVGSSMLTLGVNRWRQGAHEEAAELMEQGLKIEIQSLGEEHTDTGNTRYQLANVLIDLDRLDEADRHLITAQKIFAQSLTGDHLYLAEWAMSYARLCRARQQYDTAQKHYHRAATMLDRLFDLSHPKTLTALTESADLYEHTDQMSQAITQQKKALEGFLQRFPNQAPELLAQYEKLARMLTINGRADEAEQILKLAGSRDADE